MAKIAPLHSSVIAAIAAGEIVERPAIVVKELIENALDADATSISISIENGGLTKIEVTDNGYGMSVEDLDQAWRRHTTSKISAAEDLHWLHSYGFRGEALASMASAAILTLRSRTADQTGGWQLRVEHGQVGQPQPVGMPTGTTITVEELFGKLPARRKFLKSPAAEMRHIHQVVITAAIARPDVGFFLSHNQKVSVFVPPQQTVLDRFSSLVPELSQLTEMTLTNSPLQLSGFISPPAAARRVQPHQYLFVNQRPVTVAWLSAAIKHAYGSLLEPRSLPAFVLFLELPADQVDVNIHPRKETVQFLDEQPIRDLLQNWVTKALEQNPANLTYQQGQQPPQNWTFRDRTASPLTQQLLKQHSKPWKMDNHQLSFCQVAGTYLVAATAEEVLILDQHAAHERILFEQFCAEYQQHISTQELVSLTPPLTLNLSALETSHLHAHLETLAKLGIQISHFGGNQFHLTQVPKQLQDRKIEALLREWLDDLIANHPLTGIDGTAERTLAYLACRSAVQAGDPLTSDQALLLYQKLLKTPHFATCPHGRPTIITIHPSKLEKWFHRK